MTALRITAAAATLRRRLGPVPWFVLEELVLLADTDAVVETNVRALAASLSLNKDTVARALVLLRSEGLVVAEPQPTDGGRFGAGRYRAGAVPGLQQVADDSSRRQPPQPSRHPATLPVPLPNGQLRLLDAEPTSQPDHSGRSRPTSPQQHDALAPGVRGVPAVVPRDERSEPC